MIKLSPRLACLAALAGSGGSVVDVGTDHGYLPVYLAQNRLYRRVAASDIRPGPLESARTCAREQGAEGIEFYLSDGLKAVPGRFDTLVIAGMGGETMAGILSACPWSRGARLVLQPQSKIGELAGYLDRASFVCEEARLCRDAGRLYLVFAARGGDGGFDLIRELTRRRDGLLREGAAREAARVRRALAGMERGGAPEEEKDRLREKLSRLETLWKETETWQN